MDEFNLSDTLSGNLLGDSIIRLIRAVACPDDKAVRVDLALAVADAFSTNLGLIQDEPNAAQLAEVDEAMALLMLSSGNARGAVVQAMNVSGMPLQNAANYVVVTCNANCGATANPVAAQEPFAAGGDVDQDGTSNGAELANTLASGGSIDDFVVALACRARSCRV